MNTAQAIARETLATASAHEFALLSFADHCGANGYTAEDTWTQLEVAVGRPDLQRRTWSNSGKVTITYVQRIDGVWTRIRN